MNLDYCHPMRDYFEQDWERVRDCTKGQTHVKQRRVCYLPKTSGMIARSNDKYKDVSTGLTPGELQYRAYLERARFPDLVLQAESGIMGLAYETEPENDTPFGDEPVTINKQDTISLSRDALREVLRTGSAILLVDAPAASEANIEPYIIQYPIEALKDWAVDDRDKSKLMAIKLEEIYFDEADQFKETELKRYRIYTLEDGVVTVQLVNEESRDLIDPVVLSGRDEIPCVFVGSVDTLPTLDPIPLLPIAHSAVRIYQISADHGQFVHGHGQGTHWATGVSEDEQAEIMATGLGVGSMLFSAAEEAKFGILQMAAGSDEVFLNAIKREERTASANAVALVSDGGGVEAAESVRIKAAAQHATIFTILWSVSNGVTKALEMLRDWSGKSGDVVFNIQTDFTDIHAAEQLINSLDKAILSGNAPRSALFHVLRAAKLTEKTDDEIEAEILDGGAITDNDSENEDD